MEQQSAHMDMTKAHPLHLHLHPLNNPVDPRGSLKVGEMKLTDDLAKTGTSDGQVSYCLWIAC